MSSAAEQLKTLLNGPILAGVGATVDAGLTRDKFHVLPWDTTEYTTVKLTETKQGLHIGVPLEKNWLELPIDQLLKTAVYNVDNIYNWRDKTAQYPNLDNEFVESFKKDLISILTLSMAHSYYLKECQKGTKAQLDAIDSLTIPDTLSDDILNVDMMNRAATFILARMHTKYQTNHAIGGTPMQASIASSVRAFYQVSPGATRQQGAQEKLKFVADGLYWALHPLNEPLLVPHVITNSKIETALVHKSGPKPETIGVEEYFAIRSNTPPASSHHFYVAAACIRALDPLNILPYLPEPSRVKDIQSGLFMIMTHGAKLHPAARFWGLERVTCNQKLVEPICADLGYAVRKLMPASSLSASPILQKEDGLNSAWKSFIDALRAVIDEKGNQLMDDSVFKDITKAIAPAKAVISEVSEIKRFLTSGEIDEVEDDESDSDDDDDDDDNTATGKGKSVQAGQSSEAPKSRTSSSGSKRG